MQTFFCIFNENLISSNNVRHYRQFRETRDGDRLPMFPDNRAIIEIDLADRYKVRTTNGEVLFIGTSFDKAISRIYYAQPNVEIEVIAADGRCLTLEEYEQERGSSDEST